MKTNIQLFRHSQANTEPLIDDFYTKEKTLIISDSADFNNLLMKANSDLRDNITVYSTAIAGANNADRQSILKKIWVLMQNTGLNYSEFVSFWAVIDVS